MAGSLKFSAKRCRLLFYIRVYIREVKDDNRRSLQKERNPFLINLQECNLREWVVEVERKN